MNTQVQLLLAMISGWMNRKQQAVIEYLLEENKALKQQFQVSRVTYRSALAAFQQNGFIISYPKKGHYVQPRHYRVKKVGVVIGAGKESPFFPLGRIFASLMDHLEAHRIYVQLIQSSLPENLKWRALAHGVRALVWISPEAALRAMIDDGTDRLPYSQLVIDTSNQRLKGRAKAIVPTITLDVDDITTRKVRYILDRGHTKIAFVCVSQGERQRLHKVLRESGKDGLQTHLISKEGDWLSELTQFAKKQKISAVVVSGNLQEQERIAQALNALSQPDSIEVFLPNDQLLEHFRREYPQVNVVGYSTIDWKKLGEAAAKELTGNILFGESMQSRQVRCYHMPTVS